jgi:hypothetical protein
MSMQVLPTAPSPTVTHLMNLVTLISPGPGLGLLLPLRPALASSHSHSQYEQAAAAASGSEKQQQAGRKGQRQRQGARTEWLPRFACLLQEGRPLTSPRSTPRHAKQQSQDRDRQGRKAKAPHRHRPAASLFYEKNTMPVFRSGFRMPESGAAATVFLSEHCSSFCFVV